MQSAQRQAPAARCRMRLLSTRERRIQQIRRSGFLITLAMIAGDILNHRLHGLNSAGSDQIHHQLRLDQSLIRACELPPRFHPVPATTRSADDSRPGAW